MIKKITWNAFPKTLLRRYGRERALYLADRLWPREGCRLMPLAPEDARETKGILHRPHDEYCEWRITRDPKAGAQFLLPHKNQLLEEVRKLEWHF